MLHPVTIHTLPRTNNWLLQLTWVLIVVGVFIKFTVQTLNAQLWERFTDHQRVHVQHNYTKLQYLVRTRIIYLSQYQYIVIFFFIERWIEASSTFQAFSILKICVAKIGPQMSILWELLWLFGLKDVMAYKVTLTQMQEPLIICLFTNILVISLFILQFSIF